MLTSFFILLNDNCEFINLKNISTGAYMINFRKTTSSCRHDKITFDRKAGYCPDCGEYVENHWYISRCKCCGVKQKTLVKNGRVITDAKFCRNCGSSLFAIEELEVIDIVNINYAVALKQTLEVKKPSIIQTWIDQNSGITMKLLPGY